MIHTRPIAPGRTLPMVVEPRGDDPTDRTLEALLAWTREHLAEVRRLLCSHGALLFRGFDVQNAEGFEHFVNLTATDQMDYIGGTGVRTRVRGNIFTSVDYGPEYDIPLHNEMASATPYPSRVFFFCELASPVGGETPLADCRAILRVLDAGLLQRLKDKGVRYIRNRHGGTGGLGQSWQRAYQTDDKAKVEAHCRAEGLEFRWTTDNGLWTSKQRAAVAQHPETQETVWFNSIDALHHSCIDPRLRVPDAEPPFDCFYGDGTPFTDDEMAEIRRAVAACETAFKWHSGDMLMLDNLVVCHGRRAFEGPRRMLAALDGPRT